MTRRGRAASRRRAALTREAAVRAAAKASARASWAGVRTKNVSSMSVRAPTTLVRASSRWMGESAG